MTYLDHIADTIRVLRRQDEIYAQLGSQAVLLDVCRDQVMTGLATQLARRSMQEARKPQ